MPTYLRFHVKLRGIRPTIWRRFVLAADSTFQDLNDAIQAAGPWTSGHAYRFESYESAGVLAQPGREERSHGSMLAELLPLRAYFDPAVNRRCVYVYDLGERWIHEVKLEAEVRDRARFRRRLLTGARAFPKDDMAGVEDYEECVRLLRPGATDSARARNRRQWLRGWDPNLFDLSIAKEIFDRSK